ncbi:MAG: ABC transporter permease [Campylobacteraceae bacterium]|nr:ABC transporter permease [Campylobacteraceae bacterium]
MKNIKQLSFYIFFVPVVLWLALLIVIPQFELFIMSLRYEDELENMVWSFENYKEFFANDIYWLTFIRTAFYAIFVTFLTLIITFPIAFYITKLVNKRYSAFLIILLLLPFWVSELVRVYGWTILLRESGVINYFLMSLNITDSGIEMLYNDATMIMGLVYTSMLFMIIPIISSLDGMDDSYIEAAYDLGASKLTILFKIIIPYSASGIVSGCIVVFMLTLGNYLTPNLMGGKNSLWFTEQIYNQFISSLNWNQGAAFGFLLLILSSFIIWLGLKLTKQNLSKALR